MSCHNLFAVMKAHTKAFPGTKKTTATTMGIKSGHVTILSRGTVEHVECANALGIKPALKYTKKDANHATTSIDHSAAGETIFAKKVQWSDETADNTSSTSDHGNGLTTTFKIARFKEQHHTEKYRNKAHNKGLKDLRYIMPCHHHLKCQKLKKVTMSGLPMSSFKRDIVVNETGKKGGTVLTSGFKSGVKGFCGLGKKKEAGGFQLRGVKKVSKNEGNGAIFNGADSRDKAGDQFKW